MPVLGRLDTGRLDTGGLDTGGLGGGGLGAGGLGLGSLPPGTEVMHKTGTIGLTTNDVGIITLPGEAGHVVISVFVKSSEKPVANRERAIAEVTRTIYDYFLFNR